MGRHGYIDEQLAELDLFQGLSSHTLRTVTSLTTRIERGVGSVLTREGRHGYELVVLLDGTVTVRMCDAEVATRGAGDFLGEISLLRTRTQTATACVTTPVTAAVVAKADLWSLLGEAPRVGEVLRATMAGRLAETPAPGPAVALAG